MNEACEYTHLVAMSPLFQIADCGQLESSCRAHLEVNTHSGAPSYPKAKAYRLDERIEAARPCERVRILRLELVGWFPSARQQGSLPSERPSDKWRAECFLVVRCAPAFPVISNLLRGCNDMTTLLYFQSFWF